jgi:hypothetical protein
MMAMRVFLCGVLLATFASGCYATTSGSVGYSGTVTATTVAPDLVYVSPGVQVIADYDEPVFYTDGYYWRETNGTWYRSSYHTHGWAYAAPPRTVISIGNRHSYRRYRPAGYVPRHQRDHRHNHVRDNRDWDRRGDRGERRDHRDARDNNRDHRDHRAQPVRDNRDNWNNRDNRDTRDHRAQPTNERRDHQQPARDTRDHRDNSNRRDHRDNNRRDDNKRDDNKRDRRDHRR